MGQHLTGIAFLTKVQEQNLAAKGLAESNDAAKIVRLVNEAIHKTRELSRGLHPVLSEPNGLVMALQQLAGEVEDVFRVSCQFRSDGQVFIDDENVATHLFRIGQEAVNNAVKHAKAASISIVLSARNGGGSLTVADDGCGLPANLKGKTGMGLGIMNYRASHDRRRAGRTAKMSGWKPRGANCREGNKGDMHFSISAQSGKRDTMTPKQSRVIVVDDHPIVRQGLAQMIDREPDLTVCGEAEEARSALHAIATLKPDIVVMDISLNGPSGIEILKTIRQTDPHLKVLVLSMHDETVYAERALRAGANGYIMKQEATEAVLVALRRIIAGEVYVSNRVANRMLKQLVSGGPARRSPIDDLSDRELEVFRLIGEGHGTRQISDDLHLSVKTVETYQSHIKEKMGLKNARELVQYAIQWVINENVPPENQRMASGNS